MRSASARAKIKYAIMRRKTMAPPASIQRNRLFFI